jgi:phosphatidylglycerophosphatase C
MRDAVPRDRILVTESGIAGAGDVQRMRAAGVDAFLVGEHSCASRSRALRCDGYSSGMTFIADAAPDAPLVVFDFDHTLYDGDSGGDLVLALRRIRCARWLRSARRCCCPCVRFLPTRGADLGLSCGSALRARTTHDLDRVDRLTSQAKCGCAARLLPIALDVLAAHRVPATACVIATGAPPDWRAHPRLRRAHGPAGRSAACGASVAGLVTVSTATTSNKMRCSRRTATARSTIAYPTAPPTCRCCRPQRIPWW